MDLTRVSLYMGRQFLWTGASGETRRYTINKNTFSTVADLARFEPDTKFDVIMVALPNIPLLYESLKLLPGYITTDTVVLIDTEMGFGLEATAYRILPDLTCLAICSDCDVKVTNTSEFQYLNGGKSSVYVSYSDVHDPDLSKTTVFLTNDSSKLTTFIKIISGFMKISIDHNRDSFAQISWNKCLRVVALDSSSILFDEYSHELLVSRKNVKRAVQNLMEEVIVLSASVGEDAWSKSLAGTNIRSAVRELGDAPAQTSAFALNNGLESYMLVMMFQLLLLSDKFDRHCPALENTYPMMVDRLENVSRRLFLPVSQHQSSTPTEVSTDLPTVNEELCMHETSVTENLRELFFDADQIPFYVETGKDDNTTSTATVLELQPPHPQYHSPQAAFSTVSIVNKYRDFDRLPNPVESQKTIKRETSACSSLDGMDTLEHTPDHKVEGKGPMNLSPILIERNDFFRIPALGQAFPTKKIRSLLDRSTPRFHGYARTTVSEPVRRRGDRDIVLEILCQDGIHGTTTDRYGNVGNKMKKKGTQSRDNMGQTPSNNNSGKCL